MDIKEKVREKIIKALRCKKCKDKLTICIDCAEIEMSFIDDGLNLEDVLMAFKKDNIVFEINNDGEEDEIYIQILKNWGEENLSFPYNLKKSFEEQSRKVYEFLDKVL